MTKSADDKIREGFSVSDLSEYVQSRVSPKASVHPLFKNEWVKVGVYKLFLYGVKNTLEGTYIKVQVSRFVDIVDDYVVVGSPVTVLDLFKIPGTNLFFDMWLNDEGAVGVPLVVKESVIQQATLEDFLKIYTDLKQADLVKVAKAMLEKRVTWDLEKTHLINEGCKAEFVFEGKRYKYEEIAEIPTALYFVSE